MSPGLGYRTGEILPGRGRVPVRLLYLLLVK